MIRTIVLTEEEDCYECQGEGRLGGYIPRWSEDGEVVGGRECPTCYGRGFLTRELSPEEIQADYLRRLEDEAAQLPPAEFAMELEAA